MRPPSPCARLAPASLALVTVALASCGGDADDVASVAGAIAEVGPWELPPDTRAAGDAQYVAYAGAGPWVGEEGCARSLAPGAAILRAYLTERFPQIASIGGYACRPVAGSSTTMSVHAAGRALDVFVPEFGAERDADNGLGDPIANWLVENAEAIGVQYVVWDEWSWKADRPPGAKDARYGGASPHHDHVHVELSVGAAAEADDWFSHVVSPPPPLVCPALPPVGGVLDEQGACFEAFGPARGLHVVAGVGHAGALLYTDAWESDVPANWARWRVVLVEAGTYEVSVYLEPGYAAHDRARYEVAAAGVRTVLELDQTVASGFVALGAFDFAADGDEWVAVYDVATAPVPGGTHVAIDAVRLARLGGAPDAGAPDHAPGAGAARAQGVVRERGDGGCAVGRAPGERRAGPAGACITVCAAWAAGRRRRRGAPRRRGC